MRTPRVELNDGDLWRQACRLQGWSLLQPTRLLLQNVSGKERT
jgi:hypothetical protein